MIVVLHAAHYANEARDSANFAGRFLLWAVSGMGIRIPMFFVISGYCIAAISDSTRRKPSAPAQFFLRRFRRIYPPYFAITLLTILLTVALNIVGRDDLVSDEYGLIPHPNQLTLAQWIGNITLTETWRHHLFGAPELKILGHSWTLCYEEQFYLVSGILLLIAPRRFFAGAALVTLFTLALAPFGGTVIHGFFFDGRWLMFAEGIAVYYLLNYRKSRYANLIIATLTLSFVAILRWRIPEVTANDLWRNPLWELVVSSAFSLALILLHPWDRRVAETRMLRPLAWCGRMSYSVYLVHWPITVVMTNVFYRANIRGIWPTLFFVAPLTCAVSLAGSWLFHITVERRFLNPSASRADATAQGQGRDRLQADRSIMNT